MRGFSCLCLVVSVAGCVASPPEPKPGGGALPPGPEGLAPREPVVTSVPISGGTLLVGRELDRAYVSDPDRDRVVVVDLGGPDVVGEIPLEPGSQPGRLVEDAEGRVHVLLRGADLVVTFDRDADVIRERATCWGPRGIDYDTSRDELVVACVGGELLRGPADSDDDLKRWALIEPDLRDVVVVADKTLVSTFRRPKVITLDAGGDVLHEFAPPGITIASDELLPTVAWRLTEWPGRGALMTHQRATTRSIEIGPLAPPDAYADVDAPLLEPVVTTYNVDGQVVESFSEGMFGVLPVDSAIDEQGGAIATAYAGSDVVTVQGVVTNAYGVESEPVAVQFAGSELWVQTRNPAQLVRIDPNGFDHEVLDLGGDDVSDVGHAIFHRTADGPASQVACASCHPEGRDDGHTWTFSPLGPRRTQTLLGDITDTAPFHWDGDQADLTALMEEVFVRRMGNPPLTSPERKAFKSWLADLPHLPNERAELSPGRQAFDKAGCNECHAGERFTTGGNANVGTGGTFQIPSLVGLRFRAPLMHDGCADTIAARFDVCGGDDHGEVEALSAAEQQELVDFLQSL